MKKWIAIVLIAVVLAVLSLYGFHRWFLKEAITDQSNLSGVTSAAAPAFPAGLPLNQFHDEELGISFSYPAAWGSVGKKTSSSIAYGEFDLQNIFSFSSEPSVSFSIDYVGSSTWSQSNYPSYQFGQALQYRADSQKLCGYRLDQVGASPQDDESPNQPHTSFRQNGTYSRGVCGNGIVAFITASKQGAGGWTDSDRAQSSSVPISKTYAVQTGNPYYSLLSMTVTLPALHSDDYCLDDIAGPYFGYKSYSCMTYSDKTAIDGAVSQLEASELGNEIGATILSVTTTTVPEADAKQYAQRYFDAQSVYANPALGIRFDYPSILPPPVMLVTSTVKELAIGKTEFLEIASRDDAAAEEAAASQCEGMCFGPLATVSGWDRYANILKNGSLTKADCPECKATQNIGAYQYLVTGGTSAFMGYPVKNFITHSGGNEYRFTEPSGEDLIQYVIGKIVKSVSY
jgi:hypothetical protein